MYVRGNISIPQVSISSRLSWMVQGILFWFKARIVERDPHMGHSVTFGSQFPVRAATNGCSGDMLYGFRRVSVQGQVLTHLCSRLARFVAPPARHGYLAVLPLHID